MGKLLFFILVCSIGFLMGILAHVKRNKIVRMPKKNKESINLGFLLDSFFGMFASLVAVLVASPNTEEKAILIAIIAGYMGEKIISDIAEETFPNTK